MNWNSAEGAQALADKIAGMTALEVADDLEKSIKERPTGLAMWPETVAQIVKLLRASSGTAPPNTLQAKCEKEEVDVALRLLRDAWDRMDRARNVLCAQSGGQWAMLDTKLDRESLTHPTPDSQQAEGDFAGYTRGGLIEYIGTLRRALDSQQEGKPLTDDAIHRLGNQYQITGQRVEFARALMALVGQDSQPIVESGASKLWTTRQVLDVSTIHDGSGAFIGRVQTFDAAGIVAAHNASIAALCRREETK